MILIVYNLNDIYAFIPENYKQGYYVVLIISFTKIYNAFLGNVDGIIFNSIFYDKIVFIGVLLTIATIYLNYLLIPLYGMEGAAISSFIAICLYNSIKIYLVYLKFNLHPLTKNSYKIAIIILLGFIISFAFSSGSPPIISLNLAVGMFISDGCIKNSFISPSFNCAQ